MDDFDAEIRVNSTTDNIKCLRPSEIGNKNVRGEKCLHFTKENSFDNYFIFPKGRKQVLDMGSPRGTHKKKE